MDLILVRKDFLESGIFGEIDSADDSFTCFTLEHSYPIQPDGKLSSTVYQPKIPVGVYVCKRGVHQLEGMFQPFATFQICDVPGHTNILFHTGNWNHDSSGCILVGLFRNGNMGIMQSRNAFQRLMDLQSGIDEFNLTVS